VSKKPSVEHTYHHKKDRFEIKLKRFSLKKKWLRSELVDSLMAVIDKKSKHHKRGKHVDDPIKNTRLEEIGD
jgi:hypothetical protein